MASAKTTPSRLLTSAHESRLAQEALEDLRGPSGAFAIERAGERAAVIPAELGRVLQQVLDVMARGGTVTIGAVPEELTTSTAAGMLGISRPTLMKLIASGELPSHRVGSHHRLKADDVFAALRARRARERAAFAELMDLEDDED